MMVAVAHDEQSKLRALIVEDDPHQAELAQKAFEKAGFDVAVAETGSAGLEKADGYRPDAILLDLGLPDISGLDVLTALSNSTDAYILIVTATSGEGNELHALGLGADDYVTKPVSARMLVARVQSALRRRARWQQQPAANLAIGNVILDRDHCALRTAQHDLVQLTNIEFKILSYLGAHEGKLRTRKQIMEDVWKDFSDLQTRVIDVHLASIRKKMAQAGAAAHIASVRGIGFRLDASAAS